MGCMYDKAITTIQIATIYTTLPHSEIILEQRRICQCKRLMASTVNVLHVQFSCLFVFLFSLIQRSVSVLFMIISYLFNFTGFCSYSETLRWFCYQSKLVKRVSFPRCGWFISLREGPFSVFVWASVISVSRLLYFRFCLKFLDTLL